MALTNTPPTNPYQFCGWYEMAFVRKSDIEKMFEGNPYKRVIPKGKSWLSQKAKTEKPTQKQNQTKGKEENEVLDYYSGEEVMSIYKVKKSWLYTSAKRNQIPMCRIAGKNYYSKRHIDEFFGTAVDLTSITEWVTSLVVTASRCANSHLATRQSVRTATTGMLTVAVA